MEEYLSAHSFDAVVMSHMYPAHILANLKSRHIPVPKSILIATDYTCIPFMEETDCDYYVIPSPELTGEFSSYGIPLEKMLSWGIPVREEFCRRKSKAEARSLLGLSPDCGYILLSGGSIGAGKIEETIDTLKDFLSRNSRCRLIVISGNNQKLYRRLQKKYAKPPVSVFWPAPPIWPIIWRPAMFLSPSRAVCPPRKRPWPASR